MLSPDHDGAWQHTRVAFVYERSVCQIVCQPPHWRSYTDKIIRKLVSRLGIEPRTRRLRVCCSAN